jgi:hypothetical protein
MAARIQVPPGQVRWRVLVDGFGAASGSSGSTGKPSDGHGNGTN